VSVTGLTSAAPLGASPNATSSAPAFGSVDLASVLQQLVAAITQLVAVLQQQAGASAPVASAQAGAQTLAGGGGETTAADASTAGGGAPAVSGGCGCGGSTNSVTQAAAGVAQTTPKQSKKPKQPKPDQGAATPPPSGPSGPLATGPGKHSAKENAQVVAQVAKEKGVDPVLAVAMMLTESGGDNTNRTGDGGTSFGLFQLHEGGMLPRDWYRGKPGHDNVFDPRKNAEISLASLARYAKSTGKSGGALAAASQRPADPAGYARTVDGKMDDARRLLGM
jgi:hypothetical protein